jgi:hypothetical protein
LTDCSEPSVAQIFEAAKKQANVFIFRNRRSGGCILPAVREIGRHRLPESGPVQSLEGERLKPKSTLSAVLFRWAEVNFYRSDYHTLPS